MKLVKLLANLGYGSRREVERWIKSGAVTDDAGKPVDPKHPPHFEAIRFRGEPLDPPFPLTIALHKPIGYTCSADDPGSTVYDLLPERFAHRNPGLNPVGRLDKDTSGLLLLTDDGKLLHRIIHPKSSCHKTYHATLARPLEGHEADIFASGTLMLHQESKPLLPARLVPLSDTEALVTLHEGRYHQVRRMFAAVGNHVNELKRISIGAFELPSDLDEGEWQLMSLEDLQEVFSSSSSPA